MQLVAYGAQDVYLTGNPQITFFKVVYRRHTNFAVEPIQQVWNGSAEFGRTVTATLNRNGDLITNMYSVVELSGGSGEGWGLGNADGTDSNVSWAYVRRLGYAMIAETKVEIGGSKIDEQYGDWLNIWYELSHKVGQERGHAVMIGDSPAATGFSVVKDGTYLYIPLIYWFNRFNGLALPLIALQYHDVRVTIQYAPLARCVNFNCISSNAPSAADLAITMVDNYLLIDYVYLDSEERKRFAQASHEYLIEQLQFTGSETLASNNKYRLNFNHPSKYLIWVAHLDPYANANDWLAYSASGDWSAALETAAKLIFLATRENLGAIENNNGFTYYVVTDVSGGAAATVDLTGTSYLETLASKVDGQLIFDGEQYGKGFEATDLQYPATLDNVLITRNELNIVDLSIQLNYLIEDAALIETASWGGGVEPELFLYNGYADNFTVNVQNAFNYGLWLDGTVNPVGSAKLQLNGHDRFQERDGNYFNYVQPYQHFSNTPADGINVYSFALKPEDHQPSGTCNFSRIDNATLNVSLVGNNSVPAYTNTYGEGNYSPVSEIVVAGGSSTMNIYTVNYNVLRVMSGMAGTAYSN
jgi:hypothetical protein